VRALAILHDDLAQAMTFMHRARWNALWLAVQSLLRGKQLWLTGLGRSRPDKAATKHSIKAIDRLLGNAILYVERKLVCASLARHILRRRTSAVVLVDTTEVVTGIFALTAAIACNGRSLPIYSRMVPSSKPDGRMLRRFLREFASVLPESCTPIFVTDAGFETPWFDAVADMGWHYVGRLRNVTQFFVEGRWLCLAQIHARATRRAKNLGLVLFPKSKPIARRVVLSKRPVSAHRQRLTKKGTVGRREDDYCHRRGANEPWVLATSLPCRPEQVVTAFALRMQIEETFRDNKNHRWGWSLRHCRTRCYARLEILLLLAAIAYVVQMTIGFAGEQLHLQYRHQANTIRDRRVLSLFLLGSILLGSTDGEAIGKGALARATRDLLREVPLFTLQVT
jgi:hypothetical protein